MMKTVATISSKGFIEICVVVFFFSITGTNIALNKATFQIDNEDNSNKAVDGNTSPDYAHGGCTHTNGRS